MTFRLITSSEFSKIRHILEPIVKAEEYLSLKGNAPEQEWEDYFFGDKTYECWALEENDEILGCYHQRPNQKGLGGHIANGGYIVAPNIRGKGIGKKLCEHSIQRAKDKGYKGIQFNYVISTNIAAINLWKSCGFKIIGTIPRGYHRKQKEYVDAYIMFLPIEAS